VLLLCVRVWVGEWVGVFNSCLCWVVVRFCVLVVACFVGFTNRFRCVTLHIHMYARIHILLHTHWRAHTHTHSAHTHTHAHKQSVSFRMMKC